MELHYRNHKLDELCHDFRKAKKELGQQEAERLLALINLLESAECLYDIERMRVYHLHPLYGDRKGEYALDLGRRSGGRLIIIPLGTDGEPWKEKDAVTMYKTTKIILVWEVSKHYE